MSNIGYTRLLHTDLNLLTQIITIIIIILGIYFKKKGKLKHHGATLGIAVILHFLSFILVMGPIFSETFTFFSSEIGLLLVQTTWLHAVPGAIAIVLAIFLVLIWAIDPSNIAGCYKRKRIMDTTLVLWLFSLAFGIISYILFYL